MRLPIYDGLLVHYLTLMESHITIWWMGLWNRFNLCHFGIGLGQNGDDGHRMDVEPRKDLVNVSYPLVIRTTFPITSSE